MKLTFFIFLLSMLQVSCNEKQEQNSNKSTQNALEQSATSTNENQEPGISDKAIDIKAIFVLLPEDVFPEVPTTVAQRKELLKCIGEEKAFEISPTPIAVCDVKNGYLSLTGMQFGWEMCYWNLKDGRKLVALNNGTESGSEIRIFFYQNGKLTEDTDYQLGGNQNYILSDFIDVSQLSADARKFAVQQFAKGDYLIYYQLPQKGTSLTVRIDANQLMDYNESYEIPFEASKEVMLKWKNEKWLK